MMEPPAEPATVALAAMAERRLLTTAQSVAPAATVGRVAPKVWAVLVATVARPMEVPLPAATLGSPRVETVAPVVPQLLATPEMVELVLMRLSKWLTLPHMRATEAPAVPQQALVTGVPGEAVAPRLRPAYWAVLLMAVSAVPVASLTAGLAALGAPVAMRA